MLRHSPSQVSVPTAPGFSESRPPQHGPFQFLPPCHTSPPRFFTSHGKKTPNNTRQNPETAKTQKRQNSTRRPKPLGLAPSGPLIHQRRRSEPRDQWEAEAVEQCPASLKRPHPWLDVSKLSHLGVGPTYPPCYAGKDSGRREAADQPQNGMVCQHQNAA